MARATSSSAVNRSCFVTSFGKLTAPSPTFNRLGAAYNWKLFRCDDEDDGIINDVDNDDDGLILCNELMLNPFILITIIKI